MISITVDGIEINLLNKVSIIEACKHTGILIPRFCYHETLSVSGNCRMCVIQMDDSDKPTPACATDIKHEMEVYTNSVLVKKARENVMENLLINHPLDCPICDQAGECDLQDQSKTYGSSHGRYFYKRSTAEDKQVNPLVKTIMTRCITCTRCARFASEIAGKAFFGTLTRGNNTEIGSYTAENNSKKSLIDNKISFFDSEISSNVVDLCPVGALTSGPHAFSSRPWELRLHETIDINDSLGSNMYIHSKENQIMRALPKSNQLINEAIISDIARFSFEHAQLNRLISVSNELQETLNINNINNDKISLFIDENCDFETLNSLISYQSKNRENGSISVINKFNNRQTNLQLNNQTYSVKHILNESNQNFFFIGVNLKLENTILNYRMRFNHLIRNISIAMLGFNSGNKTLPQKMLFASFTNILKLFEGQLSSLSENCLHRKNFLLVFGENFLKRFGNIYTLKNIFNKISLKNVELLKHSNSEIIKFFNFKSVLHSNFSNDIKNCAINLDDNTTTRKLMKNNTKNIWVNTNGSRISNIAKNILPIKSFFEVDNESVSLGFIPQISRKVVSFQSNIADSKDIVNSLFYNKALQTHTTELFDSIASNINRSLKNAFKLNILLNNSFFKYFSSPFKSYPIKEALRNYYNWNKFTKNSNSLKKSSNLLAKEHNNLVYLN